MRLILRDKHSSQFFEDTERWTADISKAFDFQCSAGMDKYQQALRLHNTELLVVPESYSGIPNRPDETVLRAG